MLLLSSKERFPFRPQENERYRDGVEEHLDTGSHVSISALYDRGELTGPIAN